jgi:hypothetical protein
MAIVSMELGVSTYIVKRLIIYLNSLISKGICISRRRLRIVAFTIVGTLRNWAGYVIAISRK